MEYNKSEIVGIIRSCSKLGLKSIKLTKDELHVEFNEDYVPHASNRVKLSEDDIMNIKEAAKQEAIREREMQLATMDIEDPAKYEQMMLSEERDFLDEIPGV